MNALLGFIIGVLLLILVALLRIERNTKPQEPVRYAYSYEIASTPIELASIIREIGKRELVTIFPYEVEGRHAIVVFREPITGNP